MLRQLLFLFGGAILLCRTVRASEQALEKELFSLQQQIDHDKSVLKPPGDQMTPASSTVLSQHWKNFTGDRPIMIAVMDYHFQRVGNFLGNYFDDISCAKLAGLHFVGVMKRFDTESSKSLFWNALPTVIPNNSPASSFEEASKLVKERCKCQRYCWGYDDPMMTNMPFIRSIVQQAIHSHLSWQDQFGVFLYTKPLPLQLDIDLYSDPNFDYPLIPDVAIHYRCSDNLYGQMGLLSFGTLLDLIPHGAKSIYVLTEYGNRLKGTPLSRAAPHILHRLFAVLSTAHPDAKIVIRRGGNEATALAQLLLAHKATICSPSTFCLWPAIGRVSTVYMPRINYIGYSLARNENFIFHNQFKWVNNARIFRNITKDTLPRDIVSMLTSDVDPAIVLSSRQRYRKPVPND